MVFIDRLMGRIGGCRESKENSEREFMESLLVDPDPRDVERWEREALEQLEAELSRAKWAVEQIDKEIRQLQKDDALRHGQSQTI